MKKTIDSQKKQLRHTKKPAWVKLHGAFAKTKAMRAETRRIQKLIDAEFEGVDVKILK
jgi:hypothetical protein